MGSGRAAWSVVLGVLATATLPAAIAATRYSALLRPPPRGFRDPDRGGARHRCGRSRPSRSRPRTGDAVGTGEAKRGRAAPLGRLLGILGICMAASATIAVAVYEVLLAVE